MNLINATAHLRDHLAAGLPPLSLVRLLLALLQHAFARRAILERELRDELTEGVHAHVLRREARVAQEQQELVEPTTMAPSLNVLFKRIKNDSKV